MTDKSIRKLNLIDLNQVAGGEEGEVRVDMPVIIANWAWIRQSICSNCWQVADFEYHILYRPGGITGGESKVAEYRCTKCGKCFYLPPALKPELIQKPEGA